MNEERKACDEFCKEQQLDQHLPFVRNLVWATWRRAFDRSRELASQNARKDAPADRNVRFIPKSDGTLTGNLAAKEEQCYSFLAGESEKIRKTGGLAELAFGMAAIALTISGVTLITIIVQSLSKGV